MSHSIIAAAVLVIANGFGPILPSTHPLPEPSVLLSPPRGEVPAVAAGNESSSGATPTRFPVREHRQDRIGDKHFLMTTDITVSSNGRIDWATVTESTYKAKGFTGGLIMVMTDERDNILWKSEPKSFGVDGTWTAVLSGAKSKRLDTGTFQVPPDTLATARKIGIVQYHAGRNRLLEDLKKGAKIVEEYGPILVALASG